MLHTADHIPRSASRCQVSAAERQLRELVEQMVHAAIEGGSCEMADLVACLAHRVGVPYEPVECAMCGGWADSATAARPDGEPICDNCASSGISTGG